MNVRRMPSAPPNRPASKTTLSRGEAWPCRGRVRRVAGPVVLGEDERGEVDLARELDQPVERRDARVEDRRPRLDVRDLRQPARQRLHQLRLLARGAEEDARLHATRLRGS